MTMDEFIETIDAELERIGMGGDKTATYFNQSQLTVVTGYINIATDFSLDRIENINEIKGRVIDTMQGIVKLMNFEIERLEAIE